MANGRPLEARLIESLPESFSFYHLGEVRMQDSAAPSPSLRDGGAVSPFVSTDRLAVAFTLQGDVRGALVLVFDQGLDVSTYSEMGNIIASRMVTRLGDHEGLDVSLSPPRILTAAQLQGLMRSGRREARAYMHRQHKLHVLVVTADAAMERN